MIGPAAKKPVRVRKLQSRFCKVGTNGCPPSPVRLWCVSHGHDGGGATLSFQQQQINKQTKTKKLPKTNKQKMDVNYFTFCVSKEKKRVIVLRICSWQMCNLVSFLYLTFGLKNSNFYLIFYFLQ